MSATTELTGFGTVSGVPDLPTGFADRFRSDLYSLDGVRLHAVTGGSGPPLLLVCGWPQFWWQWRAVMPALADTHSVVAVDPRGVGRSDMPESSYDTGTVAADLLALMDHLGHDRFDLVGQDLGMWIGYALAADAPERVRRLVLAEANLPGISTPPSVLPDDRRVVQLQWHFMFNRLASVNERLVEGREDVYFRDQFAVKGATPTAMPADTVDVYLDALRRPGALHASFQYYREVEATMAQNQRRARTPLPMPVLAIGGQASRGATVAEDLRRVATDVTGLSLPGVGHYISEEAPTEFLRATTAFLAPTDLATAAGEREPRRAAWTRPLPGTTASGSAR